MALAYQPFLRPLGGSPSPLGGGPFGGCRSCAKPLGGCLCPCCVPPWNSCLPGVNPAVFNITFRLGFEALGGTSGDPGVTVPLLRQSDPGSSGTIPADPPSFLGINYTGGCVWQSDWFDFVDVISWGPMRITLFGGLLGSDPLSGPQTVTPQVIVLRVDNPTSLGLFWSVLRNPCYYDPDLAWTDAFDPRTHSLYWDLALWWNVWYFDVFPVA